MFMHVQDKASLKKRRTEQEQDPLLGPSSSSGQFSRRDSFTASKLTSLISSHTLHTSLPYEADEEKKRKDARIVVYTLSANNCIEKEPPSRI
jgi:hypothetical protein